MNWLDLCIQTSCLSLPKVKSNHHPLLLVYIFTHIKHSTSSFKFLKMWISHPTCLDVIKTSWNSSFNGCPIFVLYEKLKALKKSLNLWNPNTFGNVHSLVKHAKVSLNQVQLDI